MHWERYLAVLLSEEPIAHSFSFKYDPHSYLILIYNSFAKFNLRDAGKASAQVRPNQITVMKQRSSYYWLGTQLLERAASSRDLLTMSLFSLTTPLLESSLYKLLYLESQKDRNRWQKSLPQNRNRPII